MSDSLVVFGTTFTGVEGFKVTDTNDQTKTYIRPQGTKSISANGTGIDVTEYAAVDVAVPSSQPSLQAKTNVSPTTSSQTITADNGYDGLSSVQINAMPSGSATAPATITGSSATVSTGTNTLTLSKTVSVTPSVTAGYVSSGTAGNSNVSLTASVTTQAAQTIHPSSTDQSIAASRYLTGAQTIKAVTTSNLTADNIKSGVIVKIGDSTDDDCVTSVTGTYSGSGSSKNVQVAQSTSRATSSTYTSVVSLTCSTAGTYDVYWDCFRSSTGGTNGSQLYLGSTAYGTANTSFTNHAQTNHLTGVSISKNQTVAVYARSRGSNYYAYVGTLTIIQTA